MKVTVSVGFSDWSLSQGDEGGSVGEGLGQVVPTTISGSAALSGLRDDGTL